MCVYVYVHIYIYICMCEPGQAGWSKERQSETLASKNRLRLINQNGLIKKLKHMSAQKKIFLQLRKSR